MAAPAHQHKERARPLILSAKGSRVNIAMLLVRINRCFV